MPIFDQGYQHWQGPLSGHGWRWLVIARHGVKAQLKGKIVRLILFTAWIPAVALVTALALWGLAEQQAESVMTFLKQILPPNVIAAPRDYRSAVWTIAYSFFFKAELAFALFLVLIVGPNLISRDLRMNALPLYFSRPLRRFDYFLGKLGVVGFYLAAIAIVPATAAYLVGIAFSLDLGVVRDTHRLLWGGTLYGLIITLSAGTLMLALSSLSRRSIYVGLAWVGFCFLTSLLGAILVEVRYESEKDYIVREGRDEWLRDHPPPPGVKMWGNRPALGYGPSRIKGKSENRFSILRDETAHPAPFTDEEAEAADHWFQDWSAASSRLRNDAELTRSKEIRNDWRPVCSYSANLDRIGDWLMATDDAWVTIGRTVEQPRAAFGPIANIHAGGRLPKELMQPANERMLADRIVWQFPVVWSIGVLGGLWLISVWVLSFRVKSLDRLK